MSQYFPPYKYSSGNIKAELDLSNYATKDDVKNITHVDVSSFASKTDLAALKTEVDKIDTGKLKAVPDDLAKLSNVVTNEVVKKTDYNTKIFNIETQITLVNKNALDNLADIKALKTKTVDTSNFNNKAKFNTDTNALDDKIDKVDKKIPDVTNFVKETDFDSKITEVEGKIPNISGLATNSSLTAAENKIPDITSLIKKTDFHAKLKNISDRVTNNYSDYYSIKSIEHTKIELPRLKDYEKLYVYLQGSHFQQNKVIITNNNNVINIYVVYKLDFFLHLLLQEMIHLQFKMLNLVLCKLLKTLILQNIIIKGIVFVLMKVECLVKGLLTTEGTY